METRANHLGAVPLCHYVVASGDMFYSDIAERVVYISTVPADGFRMWVQVADQGPVLAVGLCQVFLEYAMTCAGASEDPLACSKVEAFGRRLGAALSSRIKTCAQAKAAANLAAYAIECVLKTMDVPFTLERRGSELRYVLEHCPLGLAAESTGLREMGFAYRGVNAMCRSLIDAIEPGLVVHTPQGADAEHVFSLVSPSCV